LSDFFVAVLFILGLVAAGIWKGHLRDAKLLRIREMIHQERKSNMGSSPSSASENQALDEFYMELARSHQRPPNLAAAVMWVRLTALCIGFAGLFGGVGTAIGMYAVTADPDITGMWSMGIIPAAIGLGLLIFYYLSRNFSVPSNGD
jgi:hypothetical protein